MNIQDLSLNDGHKIDRALYSETQKILGQCRGVKTWRYLPDNTGVDIIDIQYSGFVVQFCFVEDVAQRMWDPEQSYDKNYFCTYIYKGRSEEFDCRDHSLIKTYEAQSVLNTSVVLDYPTYEKYYETVWLCFSSWKPYTASCIYVNGPTKIDKSLGLFVVLGEVRNSNIVARPLDYIEPTDSDTIVDGENALAVLVKHGTFTNVPP